jgi:hypothetical protein
MITNYITPLDERARQILCSHHRTVCAIAARDEDWNAYRISTQRIDAIRQLGSRDRIALDAEEFSLIETRIEA